MTGSDTFFDALSARRSIYAISATSPIPDSRITEIVEKTIKNTPSTYNVQSARAVVLLKDEHRKLWDYAEQFVKANLPDAVYQMLAPRIALHKGGYGSVLFFEDEADLTAIAAQHANVAPFINEWSDTSSGMHQLAVWTALTAEGLGASLQHYNFLPVFSDKVREEWNLPKDWKLKAQLVFGTPTGGPMEKTSKPLEDRVKVFGQ
ncbi:conserved hypothetical protein [Talaromyces stipitatus ATCC 10500]|uniref:Nitroreductase domain-containing protein n=1 Tax=Talaromyces stipitatus (strain ATCC 10500 / CBS 375.48 / QM 6759 / NRRL 1006) TaxID=441959 RepID=B8M573_TALSN|nr:uncharacterized protein TSTA_029540 [Talaromyces stipitatus ATCC 10500]EED19679.1 conserved hypothetical protein [Talaromyces stipitatus ATCC 10500]